MSYMVFRKFQSWDIPECPKHKQSSSKVSCGIPECIFCIYIPEMHKSTFRDCLKTLAFIVYMRLYAFGSSLERQASSESEFRLGLLRFFRQASSESVSDSVWSFVTGSTMKMEFIAFHSTKHKWASIDNHQIEHMLSSWWNNKTSMETSRKALVL